MRVLQVYRDHFRDLPGGIERHVLDVALGLSSKHEIEVVACARRPGFSTHHNGITLAVEREYGRPLGIPISPGLFRKVRTGYDLLHVHSPHPTGELACWSAKNKVPFVATYHADSSREPALLPAYRELFERILRHCDRLIVSSRRLLDNSPILSPLRIRPEIVEVVPFGVDTQRFRPKEDGSDEEATVLFVGRLRYYKGLRYLIEAVARSEARLMIAGDGQQRKEVVAYGRACLGDRFTFLGVVEEQELVNVYQAATVFCLPSTSRAEAFGLSALEAMSCGVPVITTELGTATSEINQDGVTGRVVPPRDVDELAAALDEILGDERTRARMSAAARARVVEQYDQDLMLQRISDIYEDVRSTRRL